MTPLPVAKIARRPLPLPPATLAGFLAAMLAVIVITYLSYQSLSTRQSTAEQVTRARRTNESLQIVLSSMKDAETGQRGYLLTGTESYLEPFIAARNALPSQMLTARELMSASSKQTQRIDALDRAVKEKLDELGDTVEQRRKGDMAAAMRMVQDDRGKLAMDRIRSLIGELENEERTVMTQRQEEWRKAVDLSYNVTGIGALLLLVLIASGAVLASRDYRFQQRQLWLRSGLATMSARIQGEQRLDQLGESVLSFLTDYLEAPVGAVYVTEPDGSFKRFAGHAIDPAHNEVLRQGDGLLGQVAKLKRSLHITEVPAGYLPVSSSLGSSAPGALLLAPAMVDGDVLGVIELGFLRKVNDADKELLDQVTAALGSAVRASRDRSRLETLLEETQRQAEELQAQQEELRVSNEELEEQERALKESQAQMEIQQTELEQTNSQLEEQTQMLENQKDELTQAQSVLNERATELERSNRYKTEFLANMSHELRTPLNSTLILAKLLADNQKGNLTDEQVKFAQTISAAGNDLLTLINDILDLSKIEAGKVEVNVEQIAIAAAVENLVKTVEPIARQKGLGLSVAIDPIVPARFETDGQRLGQILKNLLSNAMKFTAKGEVAVHVFQPSAGKVSFAVRDSGIGIPEHQQELIFEAFRQADGSTHRKYGGTGLGLSISRDLSRLLGGGLTVQSTPGEGSTFTLTLPLTQRDRFNLPPSAMEGSAIRPAGGAQPSQQQQIVPPAPPADPPLRTPARTPQAAPVIVEDDRAELTVNSRLVLVIEDDPRFAVILRDLAHEMNFQCVVVHTASEGVAAAAMYRPRAILLDMNLPDYSGLGVLDQLKHNAQTRHIPVHILSVADYTKEAMERGAVGYDLKPVKRTQIVEALEKLEAKFSQSVRRVLVVEDDARQRESIQQLLGTGDVQITAVETGAEALAELKATTFDCMIMDLNLPDLTGYELLERMAEQEEASFPPVIVYTGRSLDSNEEQQLRRFSKSIIIKDARSPERLLDEVTLFLHQVESSLPAELQQMLRSARDRDSALEGRRILVVEDDVRNIFALTSVLEPKGAKLELARNGREALDALAHSRDDDDKAIDLVLMDIMMPEMDGLTAMREIRKQPVWNKLPIIALTAKAMRDDQEKCLSAGANDYIAKPLDVEKLLSLIRVWMPK